MRILLADDEKSIAVTLGDELKKLGHQVTWSPDGQKACHAIDVQTFDCVITDVRMPKADGMSVLQYARQRQPEAEVILITAFGNIEAAVAAVKAGAFDFIQKPFLNEDLIERVKKIEVLLDLKRENRRLKERLDELDGATRLVGSSRAMAQVLERVRTVARSEAAVLVQGPSGTGKELVADAIHQMSPRRAGPLVKMSCSAVPETLIEDELFGHVRGAFTDARADKAGRFEQAHRGTIFIDDIDDLAPSVQVKLLRVLQEGQVQRIGDTRVIEVDVRLVAATKRDLWGLCQQGAFREDLYFRLNVVKIELPALSERVEDVPLLVHHFIRKHGGGVEYTVDAETMLALQGYGWPGNVRELENAVERAIALAAEDRKLTRENLLAPVPMAGTSLAPVGPLAPLSEVIAQAEMQQVQRVLKHTGGNRKEAAALLGVSVKWLWERMKRYGIED
jgi:DNA-binding NtrC family response regulator